MAEQWGTRIVPDEVKIYSSDSGHRLDSVPARAEDELRWRRTLAEGWYRLQDRIYGVGDRLAYLESRGRHGIAERPWACVSVAALAGALVGALLARRTLRGPLP